MTEARRQGIIEWCKKMFRIHSAWVSFAIGGAVGTGKILAKVNDCYINLMVAVQKGQMDRENMQRELSDTKADLVAVKADCREAHQRLDDKIENYIVNK